VLLVQVAPGVWSMSHTLVGTAALERLDDIERRRLHGGFVDLDRLAGEATLDEVARHVVGAGALVAGDSADGKVLTPLCSPPSPATGASTRRPVNFDPSAPKPTPGCTSRAPARWAGARSG